MTATQVRNLIRAVPADLTYTIDSLNARNIVKASEKTLKIYRESLRLELSDKERNVLRKRLIFAAGRLQQVVEAYDFRKSARYGKQYAQQDRMLFEEIAAALELTPQELQARI